MRKIFILISLLILCIALPAEQVSFENARKIADNWTVLLKYTFRDSVSITRGETIKRNDTTLGHVFHLYPRGYILVSGEDYLPPVKLYSLKNNFGEEGIDLEEGIFTEYLDIVEKVNKSKIDPVVCFDEQNNRNFRMLAEVSPDSPVSRTLSLPVEEVAPLLETMWSQREPYNLKCPVVNGERCVTGCVATQFAQVMKYYEHPARGQGSRTYTSYRNQITLSASFDHPYDWDRMLNTYTEPDSGTTEEREAVSQLMFDVGVALNMDYDPNGSGSNSSWAVGNFPYYFDYTREMIQVYKRGRDDAEWFSIAKEQVDLGFPVSYSIGPVEGAGHSVVIDGYRISGGQSMFHINMGWGGSWDGYYAMNNIVVRDGLYDFSFVERQNFVLRMVPPDRVPELPPLPVGAAAYENRSLFLSEYICELTWQGIPGWGSNIDKYVIVRYNGFTGEESDFAEVDHTGQGDLYCHTFRLDEFSPDTYFVYAVRNNGERLPLMFCHLLQKN